MDNTLDTPIEPNEVLSLIKDKTTDHFTLISLLHKHISPGIHYLVCTRLRDMSLNNAIPQLIQIMIHSDLSIPVYSLLVYKAKRSLSFQTHLFFNLRSILSKADESIASRCYYLCCDLFDIDKKKIKKNLPILQHNHRIANKRRRIQIQNTVIRKHNTKSDKLYSKTKSHPIKIHRTVSALSSKSKMPAFSGLVFFFIRAVSSIVSQVLFTEFKNMSRFFNIKIFF